MAINKEIVHQSDTHILLKTHADAGNANKFYEMDEFAGGSNGTSSVAIERIEYSLFPDNASGSEERMTVTFSRAFTHSSGQRKTTDHVVLYRCFGQGEKGEIEARVSEDMNPSTQDSVRFVFEGDCKGTVLVLLRKISGFS
tara:strand:+ start:197 stop:619 length:423 start_codon:yes stop_codon:yes gene_type:complete